MNPPTVPAFAYSGGLWIECPFCGGIHFHGHPAGHRIPHCHDGPNGERPPPGGYVLELAGTKEPPPVRRRPKAWARKREG